MKSLHRRIADRTAPAMFAAALMFLICQAVLIVIWVDVPALREKTIESERVVAAELLNGPDVAPAAAGSAALAGVAVTTMWLIWPIVMVESVYHWIIRPKTKELWRFHFFSLFFVLCPSLRLCARSVEMDGKLWLPGLSWQNANRRLRRQLEQRFSVPMIGIALLILPVLITEFFLKEQVDRHGWLRFSLHVSTGVIWFAFAAEFILMVSIAEKKLDYIRRNWVDLAIIVLPLFSFLRSLQAVRGSKLAKLARLPQITKLVRAYRLRGTALKAFRALILLDVSTRVFQRSPEKQIERLEIELKSTQKEVRLMRLLIARLKREIAERDASE